jgi:transposase
MGEKSKVISGSRNGRSFTISERHQIIQEMLSSQCTKREIWEKYTGQSEEHGCLLKWMRQLGYDEYSNRRFNFDRNNLLMTSKKKTLKIEEESFELLQLKDAEMKAIAFSTMVDIAEKEFNIPIRKKLNTKPLKK